MTDYDFYNAAHAGQYLGESIVMLNGNPILVLNVMAGTDGGFTLYYSPTPEDGNGLRIAKYPNDQLDLTPVPLGMLETEKNLAYIYRVPARQWRIGLTRRNMAVSGIGHGLSLGAVWHQPCLRNCIMGEYRPLEQVWAGGWGAISRRFGLWHGKLHYKMRGVVGDFTENDGLVLAKGHAFLLEALAEDINDRALDRPAIRVA